MEISEIVKLIPYVGPAGAVALAAVWYYVDRIRPRQLDAMRQEREARRQDERQVREDLMGLARELAGVVAQNTKALLELKASIERREELEAQRTQALTEAMRDIRDNLQALGTEVAEQGADLAALYGSLGRPRPSRQQGTR